MQVPQIGMVQPAAERLEPAMLFYRLVVRQELTEEFAHGFILPAAPLIQFHKSSTLLNVE